MRQLNDLPLTRARAALHVAVRCFIGALPGIAAPVPTIHLRELVEHGGLMLRLAALLGICTAVWVPYTACAQEASAHSAGSGALEEIVVTAEHVQEDAQKTPIAMSVYSGDLFKDKSLTNITDLSTVAPDVNISTQQGTPILAMRGVSSRDLGAVADPDVTVNIDGFYQNTFYALSANLYDLARVEVLRGPQGTLNGRNSVGGAINIVTAQPTHDNTGYASLEYGNFNELKFAGMLNVPVADWIQVRGAFLAASHDGYRDNSPHVDGDDQDDKSGRIEIAFEPIENFRGLVTGQYTSQGGAGDVSQDVPFVYNSSGAVVTALPAGINSKKFMVGTDASLTLDEMELRYNFVYDISGIELTLLGGYAHINWNHPDDNSSPYATPSIVIFEQTDHPTTLNEEVRIASHAPGPFQWQAGAFIFDMHSNLRAASATPLSNGTLDEFFGYLYHTTEYSRAGYGQASYDLTDNLKLTGGIRYTSDGKSADGYVGDLTAKIIYKSQIGQATTSKTTYHGAIDYQLSKQSMVYAKVDTGYKTGGFNYGAGTYGPENITTYELGSKNRFLDDTLQMNADVFYSNYKNMQVSTATLLNGHEVGLTENAGSSRLWGVETELTYVVPVLGTLDLNVDYLNAKFTNFLSVADFTNPNLTGNVQLAGITLPQAPAWSAVLSLEHSWAVPEGTITGNIQSKIQSSENFSIYNYPDTQQRAYTMSNALVSYAPNGARWKVSAFVKNLEDARVFATAFESQYAYSYTYEFYPPRTYGARIELHW
jgi:iron complex outermembrane receptor protein